MWIVFPLVFFAGFVDSIAGGGGLISLTAYRAVGLPAHMAAGTNKFSSSVGTAISAGRFVKSGHIHWPTAIASAIAALFGSAGGAQLALYLDERILAYIMTGITPLVAVFLIFNKDFTEKEKEVPHTIMMVGAGLIGLVMGAYDGFFGPGTGTFLIIAFTAVLGMPLLTAAGNTKIVNLSSNIAALVTYIINGNVIYKIAIPAAACSILGNYLGAGFAMKKGAKAVRPMMIFVIILLLAKVIWDLVTT